MRHAPVINAGLQPGLANASEQQSQTLPGVNSSSASTCPKGLPRSNTINIDVPTVLDRNRKAEVFRTPGYVVNALLDYRPSWFKGQGFDPSAGDGRMLAEIVRRGNIGPHFANDLRVEEEARMRVSLPQNTSITIGDYLDMASPPAANFMLTNPPFTKAEDFVKKARTHVGGPIIILQSVAFQGTKSRSIWLKNSGLAFVLNIAQRPKWEVDVGAARSGFWDFAWYVFLPCHTGLPQMDWL